MGICVEICIYLGQCVYLNPCQKQPISCLFSFIQFHWFFLYSSHVVLFGFLSYWHFHKLARLINVSLFMYFSCHVKSCFTGLCNDMHYSSWWFFSKLNCWSVYILEHVKVPYPDSTHHWSKHKRWPHSTHQQHVTFKGHFTGWLKVAHDSNLYQGSRYRSALSPNAKK